MTSVGAGGEPAAEAQGGTSTWSPERYMRSGFVLTLVLRLLTSTLLVVVPLYAHDVLGASEAQLGVYILLLWIGNAAGVLLAVWAIAKQSASSLLGFLVLALSTVSLAFGRAGTEAYALMALAGIGMGLAAPFLTALMHLDSASQSPFQGMGLNSVALGIGIVAGPLLASILLYFYSFEASFLALGAFSLFGAAVTASRWRRRERSTQRYRLSVQHWLRAFRNRAFTRAFLVNLLYSLLLPAYLSFGGTYVEVRFGFTATEALLVFAAVFAGSTLVRAYAVRIADRIDRLDRLLTLSVGLLPASLLAVALAPSWYVLVLGLALFSLPHALVPPVNYYHALKAVDGDTLMNASYAFQASSGVAELLVPATAVVVISAVGLSGLYLGMVPFAVAALVLVLLRARRPATPA